MLKELRKGAAGFFAKLLLGVLTLSFILWGVGDILRQNSPQTVATVGGEEISRAEFDQQIAILRRTFGESMPTSGINLLMLQRMVLDEMISMKLVNLEAERLGIQVSDESLAKEISRNDEFRNSSGDFDKTLFQQTLRQNNLNESQYLKQLRNELKQSLLMGILNGESVLPSNYARMIYEIDGEIRTVDLLAISSPDRKAENQQPTEEEIAAFYKENQARFTAPEFRALSYIQLTPADIEREVQVSRQEVFDLYNERSESLMIPEKRDVMQMLYATKADAENVYSILRSGKTFEEAIALVTPLNKDSLDLGSVTREQLPPEAAKVFKLGEGEFTEPTESRFGWHIYSVKKIHEQRVTPFADVQKSLEEEVRQHKMELELQETLERIEDALAGTESLADAAKEADRTLINTDPVNAMGRGIDNSEILPLPAHTALLNAAFRLSEGQRSELERQPDGSYFVVKVNTVTPPRQRTLDEVRGQVVDTWKAEQSANARKVYAAEVATALSGSTSIEEAKNRLKKFNVDVTPQIAVRRNGTIIGMDGITLTPAMIQHIFALAKPGDTTTAENIGDGYVIAMLRKIDKAPDPKSSAQSDQQIRALRRKLRTDYRNEILEQYTAYLRTRYPVQINEAVLSQLAETRE